MDISTMQTSIENERRRAMQQQGDLRMEPKIGGGWNVAREPNMEDSPYRLFRAPKDPYNDDDWGFGVDETGQGFFVPIPRIPFDERVQNPETNDMMIASASDIGQQVLQQRAAESKAGKIDRGSRSYIGEDHQRAREINGEVYWYDEYKHMPFYQEILKKHGHTEELQQIQNEIQQKQSLKTNDMMIAGTPTAADVLMPTEKGYYLPLEDGIYGHVLQNEGGYLKEGKMYDQGIHGLPVPLV